MDNDRVVREELRKEILGHFTTIGVDRQALSEWWDLGNGTHPRTTRTLTKIRDNLPTKEQYDEWGRMPHTLRSLQKLCYPTLCGWTVAEIINELKPFIYTHIKKYYTARCNVKDCFQNGSIGIIHALRTDAGMSGFADHAYPRIRTSIRRESATSGTMKNPERRPSRTEARREITVWLTGTWLKRERARLKAEGIGNPAKQAQENLKRLRQPVYHKDDKKKPAKDRRVIRPAIPINNKNLLGPKDLRNYKIQKLGQKEAEESHVREDLELTRFDSVVLIDLFDYLNHKFCPSDDPQWILGSKKANLGEPNSVRLKTIGDLVGRIAESPDFHGNPISLSVEVDEKFSMHDTVEDRKAERPEDLVIRKDSTDRARKLVATLRKAMELSPAQDLVLRHCWGLDGCSPLSGSEVAESFGELRGEGPPRVSRQRITQHQKAIFKKMAEVAYELLLSEVTDKRLISLMEDADLTRVERSILVHREGLHGNPVRDVAYLAKNYESITGEIPPKGLDKVGRMALVNDHLRDIKCKLVGATL